MKSAQVVVMNLPDTASQTSAAVDVNQAVSASFIPTFADVTAAGTIKIQACNQFIVNANTAPSRWADVPNATSTVTAGVGPAIIIPNMCFKYIRVVYTRTGGGSTTLIVDMTVISP